MSFGSIYLGYVISIFQVTKDIKLRAIIGGIVSLIPFVYSLWDKIRPMGDERSSDYGRNVWRARINDVKAAGIDLSPDIVVELGPGRNLAASIAALLDGTQMAIGVDVVKYANTRENQKIFDELVGSDNGNGHVTVNKSLIREALCFAGDPAKETILKYKVPWSDPSIISTGSVDFIFSLSVMEHIREPDRAYAACFAWLRPGGVMCHKIDHSSHGITRTWNGHYWIPDWLWCLILGKRPYLINRWTPDQHKASAESAGFEVISMHCISDDSGKADMYKYEPNIKYRSSPKPGLFVKTSIMVARKP